MEAVMDVPSRKKVGAFEKRVHEIDFIRGLLILLVLFDHVLNSLMLHSQTWLSWMPDNTALNGLYNAMVFYWNCAARSLIRYLALFAFCFVSGISSQFSRDNWKRAGEMVVLWGIILVGSRLIQGWINYNGGGMTTVIDFNIIGVLAFSTLFYCFVQKCSWKGILASTLIWFWVSCYLLPFLLAIPGSKSIYNPALFDGMSFINQADWMPLCPYIFFFFAGALFSYFFYSKRQSYFNRHDFERPVCFVGRHTLIIYLGHQAVLIPLFMLVDVIVKAANGIV